MAASGGTNPPDARRVRGGGKEACPNRQRRKGSAAGDTAGTAPGLYPRAYGRGAGEAASTIPDT